MKGAVIAAVAVAAIGATLFLFSLSAAGFQPSYCWYAHSPDRVWMGEGEVRINFRAAMPPMVSPFDLRASVRDHALYVTTVIGSDSYRHVFDQVGSGCRLVSRGFDSGAHGGHVDVAAMLVEALRAPESIPDAEPVKFDNDGQEAVFEVRSIEDAGYRYDKRILRLGELLTKENDSLDRRMGKNAFSIVRPSIEQGAWRGESVVLFEKAGDKPIRVDLSFDVQLVRSDSTNAAAFASVGGHAGELHRVAKGDQHFASAGTFESGKAMPTPASIEATRTLWQLAYRDDAAEPQHIGDVAAAVLDAVEKLGPEAVTLPAFLHTADSPFAGYTRSVLLKALIMNGDDAMIGAFLDTYDSSGMSFDDHGLMLTLLAGANARTGEVAELYARESGRPEADIRDTAYLSGAWLLQRHPQDAAVRDVILPLTSGLANGIRSEEDVHLLAGTLQNIGGVPEAVEVARRMVSQPGRVQQWQGLVTLHQIAPEAAADEIGQVLAAADPGLRESAWELVEQKREWADPSYERLLHRLADLAIDEVIDPQRTVLLAMRSDFVKMRPDLRAKYITLAEAAGNQAAAMHLAD